MYNKHTNNVDFAVLGLCLGLSQRQEAKHQIKAAFSTLHMRGKSLEWYSWYLKMARARVCVRVNMYVCVCVCE